LCQKDNYARRNQTEKHRAGVRANRALRAGAVSEPYTMQDIVDRDRTDCSFCGKTVDLLETDRRTRPSVDHTIPLARGGTDTLDNVTLMHLSCNQQKGIKIMESAA
jgi:5-methylcytosine-specific restriction endonuclease McrA